MKKIVKHDSSRKHTTPVPGVKGRLAFAAYAAVTAVLCLSPAVHLCR
nr:hypothetical protein [Anaerofilum sp. An201]